MMNMQKDYKLIYFDMTGHAEPIRYMLSYLNIDFEDYRIKSDHEWDLLKNRMPMRQVPVLKIREYSEIKHDPQIINTYYQHLSICRYLARKNHLYGSNADEAYIIDVSVDDINDIRRLLSEYKQEKTPGSKKELEVQLREKMTYGLQMLENRLTLNDGFLIEGERTTWADIYYAATSDSVENVLGEDPNQAYPFLKRMVERIRSNPGVAKYLRQRHPTVV